MTILQTCPKCGGRLKLSRVVELENRIQKRRDCSCGYADVVHVRQEITAIIEVAKRAKKLSPKVRRRTSHRPLTKKPRHNNSEAKHAQ